MSKFIWTQSAIKDLEKAETCPSRWQAQWINRLFRSKTSEAADGGNYFEYLCISANAKGEITTDLPRNKDGTKTATHKRIEQQAVLFKEMFNPESEKFLGYKIVDTQVKLNGLVGGIEVEGTADIVATEGGSHVLIDLKLTEDIENTRTPYGWGNPLENMDLLQQVLYADLYKQTYGVYPKVVLLVFEHGTQMRVKHIVLNVTEQKVEECVERFQAGHTVMDHYNTKGWTFDPSKKECEACGLTDCTVRFTTQRIQTISINY